MSLWELLVATMLWFNPWGPPSTATVVEDVCGRPQRCEEVTATYTWADASYAWCTNWYADCPSGPVQLGFCDPLHGTGEREVETNDGPSLTGVVKIDAWPETEDLFGSKPSGSYTVSDWDGITWRVVFDATLTLGAGLDCPEADAPEPVWHVINTGDPATGVQRGYLCCPDADTCY